MASTDPLFRIAWHADGSSRQQVASWRGDATALAGDAACPLGITLVLGPQSWRVYVHPSSPIVVDSVDVTLTLPVSEAKSVYLNGYQSWTDSVERSPWATMHSLDLVPRKIVDGYVLDGSGDYRFVTYGHRRGQQHGFGYGYLRASDGVTLVGSLDEDSGYTVIRTDAREDTVLLQKEPPARTIASGEEVEVVSFALVAEKTPRDAVARWLKMSGIRTRKATPLVGYTSWYRHYDKIDEAGLTHDLEGASHVLGVMDLGRCKPVFQIDDGFAKVGDWLDYDEDRFPHGMDWLATRIRGKGFVPGLWLAPFVAQKDSALVAEHPDWLQHNEDGSPVATGCNWGGAYALDLRNEGAREYVTHVLQTVTRDWGFRLLKLDFLFAACMLPHSGLNRGQLMADSLDLIREAVGDDVRLLLCGVPMVSAFGRCEYCRIGCDVGLDWDDVPYMRLLHRERVSTKRAIANAHGRQHLDGLAFRCDPDVLFLREDVKLNDEQREELLDACETCGGVLFSSDDMGGWTPAQLARYHQAVERFVARNGQA